jgi:hypothetical protein
MCKGLMMEDMMMVEIVKSDRMVGAWGRGSE